MNDTALNIAISYDDEAYVETVHPERRSATGPRGLMGRQVAGKEFLDAYLSHGNWDRLVALVKARSRAASLVKLCREHPSSKTRKRALSIVEMSEFTSKFFPTPPAELLALPNPLDDGLAWARQHSGPGAFALCGVTHTLCSTNAVDQLCRLVTGPYEPFDALICTSRAVRDMVRAVTGAYADHLRERHGGTPGVRASLEVIPLGVDEQKFHPSSPQERATQRRALKVADDEVVVLFVGRLSHHAKAHPTPLYRGLSRAVRMTGKKVHLILSGWTAHPAVKQAFLDGARVLAPNVRITMVDGTSSALRFGVWHAADIFASLPDNIQETFGLVVLEAGACGLPTVASDWDGYRDLIEDGRTGLLVPTHLLPGSTISATSRLLAGEIGYDHFLAECSQSVVVDIGATAEAFARLLSDPEFRRSLGASARRRVAEQFTWAKIIRRYEELWTRQVRDLRAWREHSSGRRSATWPACYPPVEHTFAGYPSAWLGESSRVRTVDGAKGELEIVLRMPLTSHVGGARCQDAAVLRAALDTADAGCSLEDLDRLFASKSVARSPGRASVAWMLKHGLMEREPSPSGEAP